MTSRNAGRSGSRWRRRVREIRALHLPCWLCGHEIDYDLEHPDPWSFTVDHVVPLSKGGDPLGWDNLRAAHLRCNQIKGDRPARAGRHPVLRTSERW